MNPSPGSSGLPVGIAFPVGWLPHRRGPVATFRLGVGKNELPGRWACVMLRFANLLKFYDEKVPLFHKYGLEEEIAKIRHRRVALPKGGSIAVDQTEALVATDVNLGNYVTASRQFSVKLSGEAKDLADLRRGSVRRRAGLRRRVTPSCPRPRGHHPPQPHSQ
jgi:hypothetical protein